ncbi:L-amino-acid oxidase [Cladorrhinum sp. PSN259]|nr:L-amino-acid oxidase [Cladorrhinum sp. PSN259]
MSAVTDIKARWAIEHNRDKLVKEYDAFRRNRGAGQPGDLFDLPTPGAPEADLPPVHPGRKVVSGHELPPYLGPGTGREGSDLYRGGPSQGPGSAPVPPRKVAIVGAGVSGLYIAMILEDLQIPDLQVEILEANDRIGGRVWTHHFSDKEHDYYDVGAMRFPTIKAMDRTFDLFKRVGIETRQYYLEGENTPNLFNNCFKTAGTKDPYRVSVSNGGSVPDHVADDWSKLLEDAFKPYKDELEKDWETGYKKLMEADHMSTRQFLTNGGPKGDQPKYDFFSVQWMETQNTATGLFDQSFSESVIDSFDFNTDVEWKCIEGGTTRVTDAMRASLKTTEITTKKRVVTIGHNAVAGGDGSMFLKVAGEETDRDGYSTVFSTAPPSCMARMNLDSLALHPTTKDAIRCLHYDDSVKIAMQFSRPWWRTDSKITKGGVANTDLSIRVCVYPSYNTEDPVDEPAVLLVSYTWSQDAGRVGSLLKAGKDAEDELIDFVLRDIARLHSQTVTEKTVRETFQGVWHGHSWSNDPFSSGAFALFGPGQFRNMYPYLIRPAADGKFHIVGEASSSHHAWIVGSLDSAYYAVAKFLFRFGMFEYYDKLKARWGELAELDDGVHGSLHIMTILGELPEGQHVKV